MLKSESSEVNTLTIDQKFIIFYTQFKTQVGKGQHTVIMEQDLKQHDSDLKDANGRILTKRIKNVSKSNKCNQCDYAALNKIHLRRHLKAHNGEIM